MKDDIDEYLDLSNKFQDLLEALGLPKPSGMTLARATKELGDMLSQVYQSRNQAGLDTESIRPGSVAYQIYRTELIYNYDSPIEVELEEERLQVMPISQPTSLQCQVSSLHGPTLGERAVDWMLQDIIKAFWAQRHPATKNPQISSTATGAAKTVQKARADLLRLHQDLSSKLHNVDDMETLATILACVNKPLGLLGTSEMARPKQQYHGYSRCLELLREHAGNFAIIHLPLEWDQKMQRGVYLPKTIECYDYSLFRAIIEDPRYADHPETKLPFFNEWGQKEWKMLNPVSTTSITQPLTYWRDNIRPTGNLLYHPETLTEIARDGLPSHEKNDFRHAVSLVKHPRLGNRIVPVATMDIPKGGWLGLTPAQWSQDEEGSLRYELVKLPLRLTDLDMVEEAEKVNCTMQWGWRRTVPGNTPVMMVFASIHIKAFQVLTAMSTLREGCAYSD